jgi:hypothetical protein
MPWLNLLPDDRLDLSVIFAPVFDERLDGSIEVVGHFTAEDKSSAFWCYMLRKDEGLPKGADIVDYAGKGRCEIRSREVGQASLTEDIQGVRGSWGV